jgi:predicted ATPase
MAESNEIMASQMASVYELYMQNVKEIAHDTAFNNQELFHLSAGSGRIRKPKQRIGHAGFHQCDEPVCPFGISVL